MSLRAVSTDLRVRYSETDQMGIVYHAHYLVWFEIGRTEWCRAAGLPYAGMERDGIFIPVTRVACAFRRQSSYDDPIRVLTRMTELNPRGCTFEYEVVNPDGDLLAEGSTHHVFTNTEGRPARASAEVVAALKRYQTTEGTQ